MAKEVEELKTNDVSVPAANKTEVKTMLKRLPVWGWVVGVVLVCFMVIGVVASCFSMVRFVSHTGSKRNTVTTREDMTRGDFDDRTGGSSSTGVRSRGTFGGRMMGGMGTNTSTRISGVVTAVNGDTLTVAGDGTTTQVTVSDSTTYNGSSKPAVVNDSIVVTGAKASDGSFTAATVYLTRQ